MGVELAKVQSRMGETRIGEGERMQGGAGKGNEDEWEETGSMISMMSKVSELEEMVQKLKGDKGREAVMVVGGLKRHDGETWKGWIGHVLKVRGVGVEDIYRKGGWSKMV